MKWTFKWIGIIVIGMMAVGVQTVYAEDRSQDLGNDALEQIMVNREAVIIDLAERWAAQSEESVASLSQTFDGATNEQLLAIDGAYSYEDVLEVLGDVNTDLVYTPVTPCKIVDTRYGGGGFIYAGQTRNYNVYGNTALQGGAFCSAPRGEPRAAHVTMAAVTPNAPGVLKAFPQGDTSFKGLTVNFTPGMDLNNAGTVKTTYGGGTDIGVGARYGGTHVTIQVLGYYYDVEASLNEAAFSGYDIEFIGNTVTTTSATTSNPQFFYPDDQAPNTTQVSLSSSDRVLVMVSANVYRSGGTGNLVAGTITPCYATTGNALVETGSAEGSFQGETDFQIQSTGSTDMTSIQSSYLFRTVPSGTYRFGICATRASSFGTGPNYYKIVAPKVVVIKLRP